jgi:uncharacterized protein
MNVRSLAVLLVVGAVLLFLPAKSYQPVLKIGTHLYQLEVATTPKERELGLSGRNNMPMSVGMLFVFPNEGMYGFWMKDMHFNIDMVWANGQKNVVYLVRNVSPDTYPRVFSPVQKAKYVIELPPYASDTLAVGDHLNF